MATPLHHEAGDLIMFANSSNCIGRMIQDVDESPYSHSGLAVGPDELAHISGGGSELTTISERTNDTSIYHLISSHTPEATPEQIALVTAEARRLALADLDYGEIQLGLAGLLLLTRKLPSWVRITAAPVLWAFSGRVERMIDADGTTMICSDFVYRSFEAGGVDLLPGGVPDLMHTDAQTLDEWLGPAGPSTGVVDPPMDLMGGEPGDLIAKLCERIERLRRSGPADLLMRDTEIIDDIRAARVAALHQLSRALGPQPSGVSVPEFVTPGDLLRGGAVTERDRWER